MSYPLGIIQNCEEYKAAYKAAYPLLYKAALVLAACTTLDDGKASIALDQALRQEVLTAITAASPAEMGGKGWFAANLAHDSAMLEATEDAFADFIEVTDTSPRAVLRRQLRSQS